jgi:hypothetical protein
MSSDSLILRLTGVEAAVNAASNTTVSNSSFVRVLNTSAAAVLTIMPADGSANATITLASGGELLLAKAPGDTLFAANAMVATPVKRF